MTTEGKTGIRRIIESVQVESVRLVEAAAKARIRSASELAPGPNLSIDWTSTLLEREPNGFYVLATMHAVVTHPDALDKPFVSIRVNFELHYSLPSSIEASGEELEEFAGVNGVFNAWPYGREFIQSISGRMNLPPIVAPVFRLADALKGPDRQSASPEKTSRAVARTERLLRGGASKKR